MKDVKLFCDPQLTCQKEVYPFTAKEPLCHLQWVMRCPDDKNKILGWDGQDAECRIGYIKCPLALYDCPELWIKEGACVDVVICYDFGGREMGCKISVYGWFCDESVPPQKGWYTLDNKGNETFTKAPNSDIHFEIVGCLSECTPPNGKGKDAEVVTGAVCDDDHNIYYYVKTLCFDAETGETTNDIKYYSNYDCKEQVTIAEETILYPYNKVEIQEVKEQVLTTLKVSTPPGEPTKLAIPRGAIGAEIYFQGNPCCEWQATWSGGDPLTGPKFCPGDAIFLGCTNESQSSASELGTFCVVALDDCKDGCLSVTYYTEPQIKR